MTTDPDTANISQPTEPANRPYTYDHVPSLKELMPKTGGIPGVMYAQISIANAKKAQDEGWGDMHGNLAIYTIIGPLGEIDCKLVCAGKPIKGQGPGSGARVCMVDTDIFAATGHPERADGGDLKQETVTPPAKRGPGRPRKTPTTETATAPE